MRAAALALLLAGCMSSAPREAVLTAAVDGDRACYLSVEDQTEPLLASFDVCAEAEALIGQRVRLTFETAQVQALSCQGDPSCPDTETVRLVVGVEPVE